MFTELCYICDFYVNTASDHNIRIKYKEVVGLDLDFDKNLCHICTHLINKFAAFKVVCLERALNLEKLYSSKSLRCQGGVNLVTICSDVECEDNSLKQNQTDIKYNDCTEGDSKEDHEFKDSDAILEDSFLEDNYESPPSTCSNNDNIDDSLIDQDPQWDEMKVLNHEASASECETSNQVLTAPECDVNKKMRKKRKSFTKIILSYDEQKAILEAQRKQKKYSNSVFKCHSCALGFLFKDTYQSHMVRHEESNGQYCCDVCSLRFATQNLKYMHMLLHTERYRCNKCEQIIKRTHKRRHMNECWHGCKNAVSCQLCTKVFKDPDALHQHIKRFHTTDVVKTYSCNVCGQIYNNQRAVRTHMIKHVNHRFECDICQSTFASPYTLQRHKKTHTQPDPAYCATCDKWYKSNRLYKEHLAVSMKHRQYRFECPICQRACPSRRALAAHAASVHSTDKPYTCACSNRYATARALADHQRRHRAFPSSSALCHHCGNSYSTQSKLKRHLMEVCERNDPQELCQ